jgi:hypothetical protein
MPVRVKTSHPHDDPLGYSGDVAERVRAMARDAIDGVNEQAVREEAAVLRARLRPDRKRAASASGQRR